MITAVDQLRAELLAAPPGEQQRWAQYLRAALTQPGLPAVIGGHPVPRATIVDVLPALEHQLENAHRPGGP